MDLAIWLSLLGRAYVAVQCKNALLPENVWQKFLVSCNPDNPAVLQQARISEQCPESLLAEQIEYHDVSSFAVSPGVSSICVSCMVLSPISNCHVAR